MSDVGWSITDLDTPADASWMHTNVRSNLIFVAYTTADVNPDHRFSNMRVWEEAYGRTMRWDGTQWVIDDAPTVVNSYTPVLNQGVDIALDTGASAAHWSVIGRRFEMDLVLVANGAGTATQPIKLTVPLPLNPTISAAGCIHAGANGVTPVQARIYGATEVRFSKVASEWYGASETVAAGWVFVGRIAGWLA